MLYLLPITLLIISLPLFLISYLPTLIHHIIQFNYNYLIDDFSSNLHVFLDKKLFISKIKQSIPTIPITSDKETIKKNIHQKLLVIFILFSIIIFSLLPTFSISSLNYSILLTSLIIITIFLFSRFIFEKTLFVEPNVIKHSILQFAIQKINPLDINLQDLIQQFLQPELENITSTLSNLPPLPKNLTIPQPPQTLFTTPPLAPKPQPEIAITKFF